MLGNLRLGAKDTKGYEAYLEGRVLELASKAGRKELEEEWREFWIRPLALVTARAFALDEKEIIAAVLPN